MKNILLIFSFFFITATSSAWGPEGHAIVGRLAMQFVKPDVRKNVERYLGTMSIDTAANWMDIMKSNPAYDFMRSWHYTDFDKGSSFLNEYGDNSVNRLRLTIDELRHKNLLCESQVQTDLYVLLHLMGDLHMPLHNGYEVDLGGNKITVQYGTLKTHNLHRFWDEDIIELNKITDEYCLSFRDKFISPKEINILDWMEDSRSLLPAVYDYEGYIISPSYMKKSKDIVALQLLKAGERLALILNELFSSEASVLDYATLVKNKKNGLIVEETANNVGKEATVCGRVTEVKVSEKITRITLKGQSDDSFFTVVIFARDFEKFPQPLATAYDNKNICVWGVIEAYNGKPQVILEEVQSISEL